MKKTENRTQQPRTLGQYQRCNIHIIGILEEEEERSEQKKYLMRIFQT